ncbi:unnamed protein product [Rhizophagus irregularis]|nr:unnamed protein product [Rhizophagus irregularis]
MNECWHPNPNERPTATELKGKLWNILNEEQDPFSTPTKITKTPDIGPVTANNPRAIYTSRALSAMIKSIEFTKCLKIQDYFTKELEFDIDIDNNHSNYDVMRICATSKIQESGIRVQ